MPLLHDPEYQSELDKITNRAKVENVSIHKRTVRVTALILIFTIAGLAFLDISDALATRIIIVVACLCVVSVLQRCALLLYSGIEILIAVSEWTNRKQLGEFSAPTLNSRER